MTDSKPVVLGGSAASTFVAPMARVRPHTPLIALLALGHFVVDLNQGAIPAVLPFLRRLHDLTYAQAATVVLVANLTSSLIQPLFGYLTDQIARRWILPVAVLLSGAGVALTGVAPGYGGVLLLVIVMGLGVAAWPPEAYKTATSVAGDRKATALSWFSLGGNVGIALGPPVMTFLIVGFGAPGSLAMLLPSVAVGARGAASTCPARWRSSSRSWRSARGRSSDSRPPCPSTTWTSSTPTRGWSARCCSFSSAAAPSEP